MKRPPFHRLGDGRTARGTDGSANLPHGRPHLFRTLVSALVAATALLAVAAATAQAKTIDCKGLVKPGGITIRVTATNMTCKAAQPLYRRVTTRESLDGPFRYRGNRWIGRTADRTGKIHYWTTLTGRRMRMTVYTRIGVS
jgi:hypothetical protein